MGGEEHTSVVRPLQVWVGGGGGTYICCEPVTGVGGVGGEEEHTSVVRPLQVWVGGGGEEHTSVVSPLQVWVEEGGGRNIHLL